MNKRQYDELQLLLADMISIRDEDPKTEGFMEAISTEINHFIIELSCIFDVPIPTKSYGEIYKELYGERKGCFFEHV